MLTNNLLTRNGVASGTYYTISETYQDNMELVAEIFKRGIEAIENKGL